MKIENLTDLIQAFGKSRQDKRWFFRGQADEAWPVIPKAGREGFQDLNDKWLFDAWMKRAVAHVDFTPKDDWDWLAIAQHHGLATRLLDWSMNPLIAAYFAVVGHFEKDGVIYAIRSVKAGDIETESPWKITETMMVKPRGVVPRIIRQGGVFTCHPNPKVPIAPVKGRIDQLHRFTIRKEHKKDILAELSYFGFNAYSVFPDLDGLSAHINWTATSKEYWRK